MAEQLGQASLELTVDLEAFRRGLQEARRLISGELNDVRVRPQRQSVDRSQEQRTATNARAAATAEDRRAATRVITRNLGERLNRLEERGLDVARARAALSRAATATDQGRLETARSLNRLAREFVTLEERRSRGGRTPQGGARESVQALAQAQDRRFRLSQRINRLEEQGTDVTRLRTRLGELTTSYAQRQFGSARQLSRELGRQVTLSEARLRREREIQRVTERNARLGGASEPIRGRVGVAGSPQDISAQIREGLRLGRLNASPVTGRTPTGPIPGSPADKEQQRRAQERQLREQTRADRLREAAERRREQEQRRQQAAAIREQKRQETERARAERAQRAEAARAAREEQRQRVDALREQRIREQEQRQADRRRQAQERVNQQNERRAQQEQQRQQRLQQAEAARRAREEKAAQDAAAREQRQRDAEAKRIAKQNSSPISGRLPGGVLIPGSPAFKEREQQLAQRRLADEQKRVAREQLQQQREQQRAQEQAARTEQRAQQRDQREAARLEGQRQREQERRQRAAAREEEARQARARREEERQQLRATREAERQADRKSKQRQKQQGFGDTRLGSSLGDALIGGAFPLLFGQGLGASIGGAAGGGLGGLIGGNFGFGLSLVGTALGTAVDTAVQKLTTLGQALQDPIANFDALKEAALLSSVAVEKQVAANLAAGREAQAAIDIQRDLIQSYGGSEEATRLLQSQDQLRRSWSDLGIQVAKLVAGPLTGLNRLFGGLAAGVAGPTNAAVDPAAPTNANGVSFNDFKRAVGQIERDFGRGAAQDVIRQQLKEKGFNPFTNDLQANKKALEYAIQRGFVTKELVALYRDLARLAKEEQDAIANSSRLRSANYKLIDAQAQGNKNAEFAAQEQIIREERLKKLQEARLKKAPTQVYRDIESDAALKLYELTVKRGTYERQLFADRIASSNRILDLETQIGIEQTRAGQQLTGAGIAGLQAAAQLEAAKRAEQNAQAQLRVRPSDPSLQTAAREAAKQTELAAAKARADLIEAAEAARKSVKGISEALQDAVLAQQQLVGTNQGLTGMLSGQAAYNRQQEVNAQLQNDTRAAKQEYLRSLGPNADPAVVNAVATKEFGGTLADQNAQMIQFIQSIRDEIRGAQGIGDLNEQLIKAQNDLATITSSLRDVNEQVYNAVNALAEKNWTVNVNVPGGSASGDVVGAVNSRS